MQRLSDDVLRIMFGFVAPLDVHALLLVDKQWSSLAAQIVRGDLKYRRLIKKHVAEIHDDMGAGFACVASDFRHSIICRYNLLSRWCVHQPKCNCVTYWTVGDYADAKDYLGVWGVCQVMGVATNEAGVRTYHVRFCGWDDRWNEDIKELHCFGSRTFDPDLDGAKWVVSRNPSGKMVVVRSDEAKERGGEPVSDVTAYLADPKRQFLGFRSG